VKGSPTGEAVRAFLLKKQRPHEPDSKEGATLGWRPLSVGDQAGNRDPGGRAVVLRADLERLGRYDEQRVRQRLRDGFAPKHTWVVEAAGAFAGCVSLRPADDAHSLEHFYLAPHLQGSGIGAAVLRGCWSSATAMAPWSG